MQVNLHEAEHCQNELAYCKGSWFSNEQFSIILKWMEIYHERQLAKYKQEQLIRYPEDGDGMD